MFQGYWYCNYWYCNGGQFGQGIQPVDPPDSFTWALLYGIRLARETGQAWELRRDEDLLGIVTAHGLESVTD